ncbi:MAG: energy-coupling factor transporter transmembrane protein EcfT [Lachnospiraceae bacterium]|nr:energy-coupling factor transporter transmembrane protein EcfT [Lachnospiraceae bacterium]
MLRDITIGQYYPSNSIIHRLDSRVKLVGTLAYVLSLFLFRNVFGFAAVTFGLAVLVKMSKVPFRYMVKGLRAIVIILVMTGLFNVFLTPGEPLWSFWKFTITQEGLKNAGFMIIRLVYLILGSSLLTLTTTPNQLTDGMEKGLRPLNKIGVPVHEVSMMMSIALRFIPILVEETDKIMKAQLARGADFESGNLIKKAKAMVPLLVPLFISAFRRANDLALAMEARCYRGGEGRTKMKPLKYEKRDRAAYLIIGGYFIGIILLRMLNFNFHIEN